MNTYQNSDMAWCADCGRPWPDPADHCCPHRTAAQLRLRDLCDRVAADDGINTFHWLCIFNDGMDCEYEYLNEDSTIFQVSLDRDRDADVETYVVVVKCNIPDPETADRTDEWLVESTSTMVAAS